jgi:hypothetical protein
MSISTEITEARALLEKAERESDPELETHHIAQALKLLETCLDEEASPQERAFVANIRMSFARHFLGRLPKLKRLKFDVWWRYFMILIPLQAEVRELVKTDSRLCENHNEFVAVWREDVLRALKKNAG